MQILPRRQTPTDRGALLVTSYLLLGIFLVYSNILAMRSATHRLSSDRAYQAFQASGLAQAAMDNFREQLYQFLSATVHSSCQNSPVGDAGCTLQWLDALGRNAEAPEFDPDDDGKRDERLCVASLPTAHGASLGKTERVCTTGKLQICQEVWRAPAASCAPAGSGTPKPPQATVIRVKNLSWDRNSNGRLDKGEDVNRVIGGGILTPRLVTIRGTVTVGQRVNPKDPSRVLDSGVTKTFQADYLFRVGPANVFRYAYFINNFGWFEPRANQRVTINGDIRANGDVLFGPLARNQLKVQGDLFASKNPYLFNPLTGQPAIGVIVGGLPRKICSATKCVGYEADPTAYWRGKPPTARPGRRLTLPGQPAIEDAAGILREGLGWNTESPMFPAPKISHQQKIQTMPYLGNLRAYKQIAKSVDSSLTYYTQNAKGVYVRQTITNTYNKDKPLVLIGTSAHPIRIDGPVVAEGDVIIKGVVTGRGTIYAGRNIHIIGELAYRTPFVVPLVERHPTTGVIQVGDPKIIGEDRVTLGKVCNNGTYVELSVNGSVPAGGCRP